MSTNRRRTGDLPGVDCPDEISFAEFLVACREDPLVRVQGRRLDAEAGKLRRFNRALIVMPDTVKQTKGGYHTVKARRMKRDKNGAWILTNKLMTLSERLVDWCTWMLDGDPNGTWKKVQD